MSLTASQRELQSTPPSIEVRFPEASSRLIDRVGAATRRALGVCLKRLSDRREARKLEEMLRKTDAHLLSDIGFHEICVQASAPDSTLPKPVIIAVSRLLPHWK